MKLLEKICETFDKKDLSLLQDKMNLVTSLPDESSKLFDTLFGIGVDPLLKRQEELTQMRLEESDKQYGKSRPCKEREQSLRSQLANRENIAMTREELLFLQQCSKEKA